MASEVALTAASDVVEYPARSEIPAKLKCSTCRGLAIDAVRTPCCDSTLCETCHQGIAETCPVCKHSPVSAADCKPFGNLRRTVTAYLKSEAKKREKEKIRNLASPLDLLQSKPAEDEVSTRVSVIEDQALETAQDAAETTAGAVEDEHMTDSRDANEPVNHAADAKDGENNVPDNAQNDTNDQDNSQDPQPNSFQPSESIQNLNQAGMMNLGFAQGGFNPMMAGNMIAGSWNYQNMMGMPEMNQMNMNPGMYGFGMNNMGMGMSGMNMGMNYNNGYWDDGSRMSGNGYSQGNWNAGYGGYNQFHQNQQFGQQRAFPRNNFRSQSRFQGRSQFQRGNFFQQQSSSRLSSTSNSVAGEYQAGTQKESQIVSTGDSHDTRRSSGSGQPAHNDEHVAEQNEDDLDTSPTNDVAAAKVPDVEPSPESNNVVPFQDENMMYDDVTDSQYPQQSSNELQDDGGDYNNNEHYGNQQDMQGYSSANHPSNFQRYSNEQSSEYTQMGYNSQFGGGYGFRGRGRGRYGRFYNRGGFGRGWNQWQQPEFQNGQPAFNDTVQVMTPGDPPLGTGVEGAPTGPKAMLRGRGGFHQRYDSRGQHSHDDVNAKNGNPHSVDDGDRREDIMIEREDSPSEHRARSPTPSYSRSRYTSRRDPSRTRSNSKSSSHGRERQDRRHQRRSSHERHQDEADVSNQQERREEESVEIYEDRRHRSSRRESERERRHRRHDDEDSDSRNGRFQSDVIVDDQSATEHANGDRRRRSRRREHRGKDRDHSHERRKDRGEDRERKRSRERSREKERRRSRSKTRRSRREDRSRSSESTRRNTHEKRSHRRDRSRDRSRGHDRKQEKERDKDDHRDKEYKRDRGRHHDRDSKRDRHGDEERKDRQLHDTFQSAIRLREDAGRRAHQIGDRQPEKADEHSYLEPAPVEAAEAVDPHTMEREARNRERLLKEQQRRALLTGPKFAGVPTGPSATSKKRKSNADSNGHGYGEDDGREKRRDSRNERERGRRG